LKTSSISEIKQELNNASPKELLELCLRLVKYKKENKELLSYLLYEANDLPSYIENMKKQMDEQFLQINVSNLYFVKKSLRKILKSTNKYIKYTTSKEAEAELLIYFCEKIRSSGIRIKKSTALTNIYSSQIKKIKAVIENLHEDLQHDYTKQIELIDDKT
jgi:gas vesicle protein